MIKTIKCVFTTIAILLIIALMFVAFAIWYDTFDIIGLDLYEDETIKEIIPCGLSNYIVTDEGYAYVMGCYTSEYRKYRNSEFYMNDKLGTPTPVKIYDGKIIQIIPYNSLGAILINEQGELLDFNDFEVTKVFESASYAVRTFGNHAKWLFGEDNEKLYYVIDQSGTMYAVSAEGDTKELFVDVITVNYYRDTVLVLFKNGDLNQYSISENGDMIFTEKLFEDACWFDIKDTSVRYDGEKFVYDDENALQSPLINVLTNDRKLYAIGAYNLLCCTRSIWV